MLKGLEKFLNHKKSKILRENKFEFIFTSIIFLKIK